MNRAQTFPNPPKPGARGWISRADPYPLPHGLGDRWPVTVLAVGPKWCAVETQDGCQWVVESRHLDCGLRYDICGNGSRTPEHHPAVLDYLESYLTELRQNPWQATIDNHRFDLISRTVWILRRNGREPPEAEEANQRRREAEEDQRHTAPTPPACIWPGPSPGGIADLDDAPP